MPLWIALGREVARTLGQRVEGSRAYEVASTRTVHALVASGSWPYGGSADALLGIFLIRIYASAQSATAPTTPRTIGPAFELEPPGAAVGDAVVPLGSKGAAVGALDGAGVGALDGAGVGGAVALDGAGVVWLAEDGAAVVGAAVGAPVAVLMTVLSRSAAREASAITVATGWTAIACNRRSELAHTQPQGVAQGTPVAMPC